MGIIYRAEPDCLVIYNLTTNNTTHVAGKYLTMLDQWMDNGETNDHIGKLQEHGFIETNLSAQQRQELKQLIIECGQVKAPLRAMRFPEIMNIELTNRCPLQCPQCYCDLNHGQDIDKDIALKYIKQAAQLKIPFINLSGGETLVYPHLLELLSFIRDQGLHSSIAISGWGFDTVRLQSLKAAGVNHIYVSLNGSTPEINSLSRDGYHLAINALKLLHKNQQVDYYINWVARNDNIADFPALVDLAHHYGAKGIVVLESKPDASYVLQATLSQPNFLSLADYIKKHDQNRIPIAVEPCFSPLRAYISDYFLWNHNTGADKGCGAGRNAMAVDVEGNLIPCRHLLYPEPYENIEDYWYDSELLAKLRSFEDHKKEPCKSCYLTNNCLSCRAVADKIEHDLFSGNHYCVIGGKRLEKK